MSLPKELEQVMKLRGGSVLGKKTILKSDHFPGCQNKRLTPQIDGAPNYRQVLFFFLHFFFIAENQDCQIYALHLPLFCLSGQICVQNYSHSRLETNVLNANNYSIQLLYTTIRCVTLIIVASIKPLYIEKISP